MKKKVIKLVAVLIVCVMLLSSCGNTVDIGSVAHNYDMIINSSSDIKCDYLLVYPKDADYAELTSCVDLLEDLSKAGDVIFQLAPDNLNVPNKSQKLILLGDTAYAESIKTKGILDNLRINNYYDYLLKGFGNKVSVVWKSTSGRIEAFDKLLENFPKTIEESVSEDYSLMHVDAAEDYPIFTVEDVPITDYTIVKPQNCSYFITQAVEELANTVFTATGKNVNIVDDSAEEQKYEVLVGDTNRGQSAITNFFAVTKYAIVEHGDKLVLQGGRTASVIECVNYLADMILKAYQTARPVNLKANEYILGNMNEVGEVFSNGYNIMYSENFRGKFNEDVFSKVQDFQMYYGEEDVGMNYLKSNVNQKNGKMELYTTTDASGYAGAKVNTKQKLLMKYGYIEICAKMEAYPGLWTRAYLRSESGDDETGTINQIDIFNCFDNGETAFVTAGSVEKKTYDADWIKQYENQHDKLFTYYLNGKPEEVPEDEEGEDAEDKKDTKAKDKKDAEPTSSENTETTETEEITVPVRNFSDGYHVFGVEWTDEYIRFTCDGEEYAMMDITGEEYAALKDEMYLVIETSVNMSATMIDRWLVDWPATLNIEWIDIYQRNNGSELLFAEDIKAREEETEKQEEKQK